MDNNGPSLSARALSGLGWSYLATFIKACLSLLVLVILARLLAPVDFGLFGIAWIFIMLGVRFGQAFVGPAIIQRSELTGRHIQVGFTLSVAIGLIMAALVWLLAPVIGAFFSEPTATQILQVLAIIFVINGISGVPVHLLQRELRFRELMIADVLAYSIGYGFTAIVLALHGYGVWSLVWGEIVHKLVYVAFAIRYTQKSLSPRWALQEAADLLSTGAGFSLARFFEFIARQGGYFVVGRWLGAASLGYYTRADKLVLVPRNYLGQNLFRVLFPAMAQRQQGTERLADIYLRGFEILSLAGLSIGVMLFLSAPEIVPVVLGGQWDPVIDLLRILACGVLFQICEVLNLAAIGALGAVYRQAWRQGLHAFLVVGGAWYASRWGLESVVAVIVAAQIIAYLLLTRLTLSLLRMDLRHVMRRCLPALWVGACLVPALWLTTGLARELALPVGLTLSVKVLVWCAVVIAALYYAPPCVRPESLRWASAGIPLETLGPPGNYLRAGLKWLSRRWERC